MYKKDDGKRKKNKEKQWRKVWNPKAKEKNEKNYDMKGENLITIRSDGLEYNKSLVYKWF